MEDYWTVYAQMSACPCVKFLVGSSFPSVAGQLRTPTMFAAQGGSLECVGGPSFALITQRW